MVAACGVAPESATTDAGNDDDDNRFAGELSEAEWELVRGLALPEDAALPPARGNAHGDSLAAALFGFQVFFDPRFSANKKVGCVNCHMVEHFFGDNQTTPVAGLGPGKRNSPSLLNAARHRVFLWDGRADSLWSQPLLALQDPNEMGLTRLEIAHLALKYYPDLYADAFGGLPDLGDPARFPPAGSPGDEAYDAMSDADQLLVNQVCANVGKGLEAYVRKIATGAAALDRYLGGDGGALDAQQQRGLFVFVRAGCIACHNGPNLSDDRFHNLGLAAAPGQEPDAGRPAALPILASSPFNAAGPFFDGPADDSGDDTPALPGALRTPSLRNLSRSEPYGHNGTLATLEDAVDFHLQGGGRDGDGFIGEIDPLIEEVTLDGADRDALLRFLEALTGEYPPLPWNQWPNGNG